MELSADNDTSHVSSVSCLFHKDIWRQVLFSPGSSDRRSSLTCPPPQVGLLVFLLHALRAEVAKASKADGGLLQRRSYSQDHDGAPLLGEQGTGDNTGHLRL